jgi:hypothetical protein
MLRLALPARHLRVAVQGDDPLAIAAALKAQLEPGST